MKKQKILSVLLMVSMLTVTMLTDVFAGGDTMPPREGEQGYKGDNQPSIHGYCKQDILDWTPEQDEYYDFMRAKVPLRQRNESFQATQANPMLDQNVKSLTLAGDYGNDFFNSYQYNDKFAQNVLNFWQYLDYHAAWHGMVTEPAPDSLFVPDAPWWERKYEFGVLNLPNPAYTNAAHKNGVMTLGCIFFPRAEHTEDFVYKDENGRFPLADKLVEICKYYGFDGYFVNAEERLPSSYMPLYEEFIAAMTSQGIYVQVYASNLYGQFNERSWGSINYYNKDATEFSNWVKHPDRDQAASSLYMNPDPSKSMVNGSVSIMESLGLDPRETVFNTLEAGQTGFSGRRGSIYNTLDDNLVPRTAIAHLGTEMVWSGLDEQAFGHTGNNSYNENRRSDSEYQKYIFARERTWWSGSMDQPYYSNNSGYASHPTTDYTQEERDELLRNILDATTNPYLTANNSDRAKPNAGSDLEGKNYQSWPGLAAFISERSVINGGNFYTNFNTGHGLQYFVEGEVSNDNEWANINIQDILPTWQWWISSSDENGKTLRVDFDYGNKYNPAFELDQIGGYNGGSSLVVKGDLDSNNFLRLYKTDLDVSKDSKAYITFNKPSATDGSKMSLGLIFKDEPEKVEYIEIPSSGTQTNQWKTKTLNLQNYRGRQIAAFGLSFEPANGQVQGYQMNIGEIKITDSTCEKLDAPTGLKIGRAFDSSEMYISWDMDDYSKVQKYNVYARYSDGNEVYLGGTYDDKYYIKSLYNPTGIVTIKLTAVGADGVESPGAVIERDFSQAISNIEVVENDGYLDVSWNNPNSSNMVKAEVTLNYSNNNSSYNETFNENTSQGTITVPVTDGTRYTLRLSALDDNGNIISYTDYSGQLIDTYSDVYEGKAIYNYGRVEITGPTSKDWWHLYAKQNGRTITFKNGAQYAIRGVDDLTNLRVQGSSGEIEIILEDYAGNFSEPVLVPFGN